MGDLGVYVYDAPTGGAQLIGTVKTLAEAQDVVLTDAIYIQSDYAWAQYEVYPATGGTVAKYRLVGSDLSEVL